MPNPFVTRRAKLKAERESWVSGMKTIAEYTVPQYDRWDNRENRNRGDINFSKILDSTATISSEILSSGLMTGITNPSRPWFLLSHPDFVLSQNPRVKQYLYEVTRVLLETFAKSNIYNVLPPLYQQLGLFGTAAILIQEDRKDDIRAFNFAPGEYYIAQNHLGVIDTLYRDFSMTISQLVSEFGIENVSERVRVNFIENKNLDEWINVTHAVEPKTHKIKGVDNEISPDSMWRSVYYEVGKGREEDDLINRRYGYLRVGGFKEFPNMVPRWHTVSNDVYGWGRGSVCIGDIKELQAQTIMKARGIETMIDPSLKAPSSMEGAEINNVPGGVTYYDVTTGAEGFRTLFEVDIKIDAILQDIRETQGRIKKCFYEDAFAMISELDRAEITATEIIARQDEKLLKLGTVYHRLNDELLDPMIDRAFNIQVRRGNLPEPPPELQGENLRIEYLSILAQAQKSHILGNIERSIQFLASVAQAKGDSSPWDKHNTDQAINDYFEAVAVPPNHVFPDDVAAETRNQRARIEQAQRAIEMSAQGAEAARSASDSDINQDGDTVLSRMTEQVQEAVNAS